MGGWRSFHRHHQLHPTSQTKTAPRSAVEQTKDLELSRHRGVAVVDWSCVFYGSIRVWLGTESWKGKKNGHKSAQTTPLVCDVRVWPAGNSKSFNNEESDALTCKLLDGFSHCAKTIFSRSIFPPLHLFEREQPKHPKASTFSISRCWLMAYVLPSIPHLFLRRKSSSKDCAMKYSNRFVKHVTCHVPWLNSVTPGFQELFKEIQQRASVERFFAQRLSSVDFPTWDRAISIYLKIWWFLLWTRIWLSFPSMQFRIYPVS